MNDGYWEAIRGSHRESKGDSDSEHAAAAAEPCGAGSRVRRTDEVVVGWRVWGLSNLSPANPAAAPGRPLILTSTFMVDLWHPGKPMAACCGSKFLRHGVHAFVTRDQAQAYIGDGLRPLRYVYGEVSLWGRVVIHERGYRAQFAYPRRIFVPRAYRGGRDFVNDLRRAYGVEAEWTP